MNGSRNKKILAFNGSPVKDSNTDILTREVLSGAGKHGFESEHVYLNDLKILPCQSCGKSPGDNLCFFEDDLFPYLHKFAEADIVVVSSPIYFDTVSAQCKLLIDRCNCFKPLEGYEKVDYHFRKLDLKKKLGIYILVGGEREKFQPAITVIKGFFIWTNVEFAGEILYAHDDYQLGAVKNKPDILKSAFILGKETAEKSLRK